MNVEPTASSTRRRSGRRPLIIVRMYELRPRVLDLGCVSLMESFQADIVPALLSPRASPVNPVSARLAPSHAIDVGALFDRVKYPLQGTQ